MNKLIMSRLPSQLAATQEAYARPPSCPLSSPLVVGELSQPSSDLGPLLIPGTFSNTPQLLSPPSAGSGERQSSEGRVASHLVMAESSPSDNQHYEELRNQYFKGDEGKQLALVNIIQIYKQKNELEPSDVEDQGIQIGNEHPQFRLSEQFANEIWPAVDRLQKFLLSFSSLAGRESIFIIDPHDRFRQMLSAASKLAHIDVTWKMLRARIACVPTIFEKYDLEYQGLPAQSPATTNPELYNPQPGFSFDTTGSYLTEMMRNILYKAVSERQLRRIAKGRGFEEVWGEPDRLAAAFPRHDPEANPHTITYDSIGNVVSRPRSPSVHSQSAVERDERSALLLGAEGERPKDRPPTPRFQLTPSRTTTTHFLGPTLPTITSPPQPQPVESANLLHGLALMRMGVPRETPMGGLRERFAGRNGEPSNSVVWRELAQAETMPLASIGINQPPRSVRWNFPSTGPANTTAYNHLSMEPRDTEPSRPLQPRPGGHTTNLLSQLTRNRENVPS